VGSGAKANGKPIGWGNVRVRTRHPNGLKLLPQVQNKRISELRKAALIEADPVTGITPYEVLPEILENAVGYMRWARQKVGELTEDEFWIIDPVTQEKVPCAEFELEQRLTSSVKALAETIVRLDLDTKSMQIEQGKLAVIAQALFAAAEAAGLDDDQRRKLGQELRAQIKLLEAGSRAA
jgi:hypothetical protein